jgi:glutamate dehydrogenase
VPGYVRGEERVRFEEHVQALADDGVPADLAVETAAILDRFSLLDVADIAVRTESDPADVAALYFCVMKRFGVDGLLTRITRLAREDRWDALARQALRSDLYQAVAALTAQVVRGSVPGTDAELRMNEWETVNAAEIGRVRHTLNEIGAINEVGLAGLSVALRSIRTLVAQSRN